MSAGKKFTATTDVAGESDILQRGGSNRGRRVCVVGGGIGGLTAALAFARSGAQVEVFEQATALGRIGAGIQITPNGARALEALGVRGALDARGVRATAVQPMDALTGRAVTRFDLGRLDGPPYRFFHRADLIDLLAGACRGAGVQVHLGAKADTSRCDADLVVGAEGIHSPTRAVLNGTDVPFFTGQVAWRTIVPANDVAPVAKIWMAPGRHVVTYPLREGLLNVVAVEERDGWAAEGWTHADDPANLRAAFADTCAPLRHILKQVEQTNLWGLFRHEVAAVWSRDQLAILGDAAHPTLPFLAQGANLAIEDAFILARCCDAQRSIEVALKTYEDARKSRVQRAIEEANANARNYHLSGPARRVAHIGLKTLGVIAPSVFLRRMDWLYGYDVTSDDAV